MAEILYGIRESDGQTISISDILNLPNPDIMRGKRCGCICPNPICKKPLLAKLGKGVRHGGREPHFSHFPDFEGFCNSSHANETALHMMAKEIIAEERRFVAPNEELTWEDARIDDIPARILVEIPTYIHAIGGTFECSHVSLEKRLQGIVPDIIARTPSGEYLIEISVTHPVTVEKKQKATESQLPMLEIDLSDYKNKPITKDILRNILLKPNNRTRWIYYDNKEQVLLDAQKYYRNHQIALDYFEADRKRKAELKEIYSPPLRTHKTTYNPQYYYSKSKKKTNENIVTAANYKEHIKKWKDSQQKKDSLKQSED